MESEVLSNESEDSDKKVVDWLKLPTELFCYIAQGFVHIQDLIRFGAVCTEWQSAYLETLREYELFPQLPLLMLPTKDEPHKRSFYSLSEKRVCNFKLQVPNYKFFCHGSSYGWLVIVRDVTFEVSLFNPFLNSEINLPPLSAFELDEDDVIHGMLMYKAVLSADPMLNPNYSDMAIYGGRRLLAFWKPGNNAWTSLSRRKCKLIIDVVHNIDIFYAVDFHGAAYGFDLNHPRPKLAIISPPPPPALGLDFNYKYVLILSGKFLQVRRSRVWEDSVYITRGFQVFQFNHTKSEWVEVKSLGGHILFLGAGESISLPASFFPECKPNTIYFTDDWHEGHYKLVYEGIEDVGYPHGPHDMGVFNMDDGSIEPHYPME